MISKSLIVNENGYIAIQKAMKEKAGGIWRKELEEDMRRRFKIHHKNGLIEIASYQTGLDIEVMKQIITSINESYKEDSIEYMFI